MTKEELHLQLAAKEREIKLLVARVEGLGDIDTLDQTLRERLEEEMKLLVKTHEEAMLEGDTAEEWEAQERRFAQSEIGRLLQERYEIAEQILDI